MPNFREVGEREGGGGGTRIRGLKFLLSHTLLPGNGNIGNPGFLTLFHTEKDIDVASKQASNPQ